MGKKKADKHVRVICGNCKNYFPTKMPEVTEEDRLMAVSKFTQGLGGLAVHTKHITCPYCKVMYYPGSGGKWFAKVVVELEVGV